MNHTIEEKNGAPEEVSGSSSGALLHHGAKAGEQNAVSDRVNRMGTGSIPKLVVEFAIPAILGMVVNGAYNLIDSVFLGHGAGEMGLSAITVASPTMTIFLALAMLIGAGAMPFARFVLAKESTMKPSISLAIRQRWALS